MINKVTNECNISGKLYGFGRFGLKKDEKDKKIRGSITVLTDAETQNVVEINFLPQSPTYKNGKDNNNYSVLEQIIEEEKTVERVGEKDAISVRVSCSLSTNRFLIKTFALFVVEINMNTNISNNTATIQTAITR